MNKEIEYLKEHLYEIYKYKKSMQDLTYDMDIEHLLRTCKALDYLQQEIDRLNNIINELEKEIDRLLERQYESEKFAKEQGFDTYLPAKVNLEFLKNKLNELKENK